MKGMSAIKAKNGIQWDSSQISVLARPPFFLTPKELHSDMKNIAVVKCPNS
jgi:hypothetical protein